MNRPIDYARMGKRRLVVFRRNWRMDRNVGRVLRVPRPSEFAAFGDGSVIVPPARVNSPECISIGRGVHVLEQGWLAVFPQAGLPAPRLEIGDNTRIGRACHIACIGEVIIGPDVLTADHIYIADTYHGFEDPKQSILRQPMAPPKPVRIERGAFLGIRCVILQGVTVGENAYVGAGAVVTEDVPARTLVVGNPARPVRVYDEATKQWVSC
ncbi:MAG TPA: acyltransferase [Acidimicrobiales bacterium]|nr:acyltransferase [Acidimicrobiales bacterium]